MRKGIGNRRGEGKRRGGDGGGAEAKAKAGGMGRRWLKRGGGENFLWGKILVFLCGFAALALRGWRASQAKPLRETDYRRCEDRAPTKNFAESHFSRPSTMREGGNSPRGSGATEADAKAGEEGKISEGGFPLGL